jgi:riboflavin kinase/FMN adenylyltransferase
MRVIRDREAPADARGAVAAIGNFDGVHLGHRAVIEAARAAARARGGALAVLTFEPHPREYFAPDAPPFRLMTAGAKAHRLASLGVDLLFEHPFDAALAALSPEEFVAQTLARKLGLAQAVVGADFRFGRGRAGGAQDLVRLAPLHGLSASVAPMLDLPDGEVSSTRIRQALSDGRPREAARMLGHWHRIEGEVRHGKKRGRTLGYPTANLSLDRLHPPRFGVYAVIADVLDGPHRGRHRGAASIGVRPMFGAGAANCETFLFDFRGDLYGATLSVALVEFLRPEMSFDSVPALIRQMERDVEEARAVLLYA